ncbi:MAG: pyridoxal phosphate-dependent aminotransferase, partial [Planctomycetota bacterium]
MSTASIQLASRVRSLKPSATLGVTARVKEMIAGGVDVIGFGAGEPDFDTPDIIKRAAIEALEAGRTGYEPVPGAADARAAIAEKLQRENGIACDASHIVVTTGGKHALYLALQALVDPGEGHEVVVPTPAWVSYRPMIELAGGVVVEIPTEPSRDFKITPAQLEAAITPRTAVMMINSPSNPCGTTYTPEELRALAEVIERHPHVVVISDEIYEKLIYGDLEHFSLGSMPAIADRVVTVNGLSKAYAMTGWRLGYACAPGADGEVARAIARLQGSMTSHVTSFTFPAIIAAIRHAGPDVERMRLRFAERAALIQSFVEALPDVRCPAPTGAFYVFPDVSAHFGRTTPGGRRVDSALSFSEALLEEARVAVVPGDDFGGCGPRHVRLSFACAEDAIREGCRRLDEWIRA